MVGDMAVAMADEMAFCAVAGWVVNSVDKKAAVEVVEMVGESAE